MTSNFTDANNGLLVGGTNNTGRMWFTIDGGINWTEVTTLNGAKKLNGIHPIDRNNTYIVVGNEETIIYVDDNNIISNLNLTPITTNDLYDVFFKDDINGYAVGENGLLLKSKDGIIDQNSGLLTSIAWTQEPTAHENANGSQTIRTIDFTTSLNGFLGGRLDSNNPKNYARLLRDESGKFSTNFFYDKLGRIVASQNSKQYAAPIKRYSYTLYDELGRVVEAGEKEENTTTDQQFESIYGTLVGGLMNPSVIDDFKLKSWITNNTGKRQEVTYSYYDRDLADPNIGITVPPGFVQNKANLRKRISAVTYEKEYDGFGLDDSYDYATFYDYDIHGNVKTLIQHNKEIGNNMNSDVSAQQYKRLDYDYDLISGNVHEVAYQNGEADAWYHRYEYDADNRIVKTETSQDKITWDRDAGYIYYDHGPLARTEIGELNVQGCDYAYTLQGWLKGVNSDVLTSGNDMGKDGFAETGNSNELFAKDAYGFSLNYYENDYSPIDYVNKWQQQGDRFASVLQGSDVYANRNNLYNGNIGAMVTTITNSQVDEINGPQSYTVLPQATAYHYDQLNRLTEARAFQNLEATTGSTTFNTWGNTGSYNNLYYNDFSYDASGNIKHQNRFDHLGNKMDDLDYHYAMDNGGAGNKLLQNRLYSVTENDLVHNALYDDDIEDMGYDTSQASLGTINNGTQNYRYDEIGQLTQDIQEGIAEIKWRVDGKISAIVRAIGNERKNLTFDYDPMGNRIAKHIYGNQSSTSFDPNNPTNWEKTACYNRDAQGNVMATYDYMLEEEEIDQSDLIVQINDGSLTANTIRNTLVQASPLNENVIVELLNSSRPNWVKNEVLTNNTPLSNTILETIVSSTMGNSQIRDFLVGAAPVCETILIDLINANKPNWVADEVLSASAPLTDNVLLAIINHSPAYPNWLIRDLMADNTQLTPAIWTAINSKGYPNWIITGIQNANAGYLNLPITDNCNNGITNTAGTTISATKFSLIERNIYGSSRVGMERTPIEMIGATTDTTSYSLV